MIKIFICHAWDYDREYHELVTYLKDSTEIEIADYSVPEHDPLDTTALASKLREQVRQCSVFIVIDGQYINYREWMKKEIKYAKSYNKPILGVTRWAMQNSSIVKECATKIVGWNKPTILNTIKELAK